MAKMRTFSLFALVFILVLSSCSPQPTASAPAAAAPTNAAAATEAPALAKSIVFVNTGGDWGDCMKKAFSTPFEEKYGVKIIDGPFLDDGQIKAAVESGNYDADVVFPTPSMALDASGAQYLEPIDYSLVSKDELYPGTYTNYAVAIDLFSWAFGYRTDKGPAPIKWSDFFDTTHFPGKRGLVSWDYATVLVSALLADGVAPDQLIPLDVNRALKKLDTIKNDIVWFDTGSAGQDLLDTGEVSYIQLYANRITSLKDKGSPVDIVWDGQIVQSDYVGVPKGSPNVATAMKFIAHMTSKEINGQFSYCQPAAPSNSKTTVNPDIADELPTSHMDGLYVISSSPDIASYIEQHTDEITNAFNNWKSSK